MSSYRLISYFGGTKEELTRIKKEVESNNRTGDEIKFRFSNISEYIRHIINNLENPDEEKFGAVFIAGTGCRETLVDYLIPLLDFSKYVGRYVRNEIIAIEEEQSDVASALGNKANKDIINSIIGAMRIGNVSIDRVTKKRTILDINLDINDVVNIPKISSILYMLRYPDCLKYALAHFKEPNIFGPFSNSMNSFLFLVAEYFFKGAKSGFKSLSEPKNFILNGDASDWYSMFLMASIYVKIAESFFPHRDYSLPLNGLFSRGAVHVVSMINKLMGVMKRRNEVDLEGDSKYYSFIKKHVAEGNYFDAGLFQTFMPGVD